MEQLANILRIEHSGFKFVAGSTAHWSPQNSQITYVADNTNQSKLALLHELSHATLGHGSYQSDIDLLQKESEAWKRVREIANKYNVVIDNAHIQDCLDTYRDWLYQRSTCPSCDSHGVQSSKKDYACINCGQTWKVSTARFCRPYRLKTI